MKEHTPGPWTYRKEYMGGYDCMTDSYDIYGPDGEYIAILDMSHYGQKRRKYDAGDFELCDANAALIAAAPLLLKALRRMEFLFCPRTQDEREAEMETQSAINAALHRTIPNAAEEVTKP